MAIEYIFRFAADDEIVTLHFKVRSLNILKLEVEALDKGRKTASASYWVPLTLIIQIRDG